MLIQARVRYSQLRDHGPEALRESPSVPADGDGAAAAGAAVIVGAGAVSNGRRSAGPARRKLEVFRKSR